MFPNNQFTHNTQWIVKIVIWIISSQDSGYGKREECKESMVFGFSIKLRFNSLNSHVGV